jgi:hypothetical protein
LGVRIEHGWVARGPTTGGFEAAAGAIAWESAEAVIADRVVADPVVADPAVAALAHHRSSHH